MGIMTIQEALRSAESSALDLVEVAPNAEPPVCRIMDYGKFVFEQNKKAQSARRKQKQIQVKEIKFRPGTEEGDYQVKLRILIKFLPVLFPQQNGWQPECQCGNVGDEAQHNQHRDVEHQDAA